MELLKIDNNSGVFLNKLGAYESLKNINSEDVKRLINLIYSNDESLMDEYDEEKIKNPAEKIIYENLYNKLTELKESKEKTLNEINSKFKDVKEAYEV